MEWIWILGAVLLTALLAFCLIYTYKLGYKAGANMVLRAWKETNDYAEENYRR